MAALAGQGRPRLALIVTDESFQLHVLPARNGDALVLEYGSGHDRQRILIDGGIGRAAAGVKAFLGDDSELELLVVTHIDNDHIGGLLRLFEMPAPPMPADVWFNGYRHLPTSALQEMGPVAGEKFTTLILKQGYRWNDAFNRQAVKLGKAPGPPSVRCLKGGLQCIVLSPGEDQLVRLRKEWVQVVRDGGLDPAVPAPVLRLANALAWWWVLRGRLADQYRLLCQAAGHAETGSRGWCAAQLWLGQAAQDSADLAAALSHFTALRDAVADRPPSPALTSALAGRAGVLRPMGRADEAAGEARRALALAREIGHPAGELWALAELSLDADYAGDHDEAVRLARQAGQITAGVPGAIARYCSFVLTIVLAGAGDLAEAERVGAAGLARARDAGDLRNQALLLIGIVDVDLRAGRTGDATAHLREELRLAVRTGNWFDLRIGLFQCGTCAPRPVAARRPSRSGPRAPPSTGARAAPIRPCWRPAGMNGSARPGRRWDPAGHVRRRSAARR